MKNLRIFLVVVLLFVIIIPILFIFNNKNKSQSAECVLDSTSKDNITLVSKEVKKQSFTSKTKVESKKIKSSEKKSEPKTQASFSYKVKKGDCLWKIAKKMYGDGNLWILIFDKNKEVLKSPDMLTANLELVMPDLNQYKKSDIQNIEHNVAKVNSKLENKDDSTPKISDLDNKKVAKIYKEIYNSYKNNDTNSNAFDYLIMAKKADPEIFKDKTSV